MKRYQINRSIKLFRKDNIIKFIYMNEHREITVKCNSTTIYLIKLLSKPIGIDSLISKTKSHFSLVTKKELLSFVNKLIELDIIHEVNVNGYHNPIVDRQINFYSNIVSDPIRMQKILEKKTVLILGLGGSGSAITYFLAQSGVKHFILLDPDKVDITNLGRQALYFKRDVGKLKVDVLSERIKSINPEIEVQKNSWILRNKNDFNKINLKPDLVINCLDEPNSYITGKMVTDYYLKRNVPMINGIGYRGQVISLGLTTIPGKTICWNCANRYYGKTFKGYKLFLKNKIPAQAGITSPLANFIASIHAQEAINILVDELKPILINRVGIVDFLTLNIKWYAISNRERKCEICRGEK